MPKLTRRIATVELADERLLTVRITNPDTLRYEETAQREGWPGMTFENGVATLNDATRRSTFEAWAALRRTDQYKGTWPEFKDRDCLDISVEEEEVDPTRPALGIVSSLSSPGTDDETSTSSHELTTT